MFDYCFLKEDTCICTNTIVEHSNISHIRYALTVGVHRCKNIGAPTKNLISLWSTIDLSVALYGYTSPTATCQF